MTKIVRKNFKFLTHYFFFSLSLARSLACSVLFKAFCVNRLEWKAFCKKEVCQRKKCLLQHFLFFEEKIFWNNRKWANTEEFALVYFIVFARIISSFFSLSNRFTEFITVKFSPLPTEIEYIVFGKCSFSAQLKKHKLRSITQYRFNGNGAHLQIFQ